MTTLPIELLEKKLNKLSSLEKVIVTILLIVMGVILATRELLPLYGYNSYIIFSCLAFFACFLNVILDMIYYRLVQNYNKDMDGVMDKPLKIFRSRLILAFFWGIVGLWWL